MDTHRIILGILTLFLMICSSSAQIKPGRAIQITVSGIPNEEKGRFEPMYSVSDEGNINMPLIGVVRAAGKKSDQLALFLQNEYKVRGIYSNVTFQVFDSDQKRIDEQIVVVGGFVTRPGPVPFNPDLTLWQAIQTAGGPTAFGSMGRVTITRQGQTKEFNCNKPEFQQKRLRPGDAVNVPQKDWLGR